MRLCVECTSERATFEENYCFECYLIIRKKKAKGKYKVGSVSTSVCKTCEEPAQTGGFCSDCRNKEIIRCDCGSTDIYLDKKCRQCVEKEITGYFPK
jgi:hypothetical protein